MRLSLLAGTMEAYIYNKYVLVVICLCQSMVLPMTTTIIFIPKILGRYSRGNENSPTIFCRSNGEIL